ncbi:acylase [soil metagenome]
MTAISRPLTLALFLLLLVPVAAGQSAEIVWDDRGVPHINATDRSALFEAYGYAQMELHANALLRLFAEGSGEAARHLGPDFLDRDRLHHALRVDEDAARVLAEASPPGLLAIRAFTRGLNRWADAHPDRVTEELRPMLPVGEIDVARRAVNLFLLFTQPQTQLQVWRRGREATNSEAGAGSNAWAIGPSRTEDGRAVLLGNPHLPWADEFRFVEAHLTAPDLNIYGVALIGMPTISIGFTESHGWTHTVNTQDYQDFFELQLTEGGYLLDGEVRAFERDTTMLAIAVSPDSIRFEPMIRLVAEHGPVLAVVGDRALARRVVTGYDPFTQWLRMAEAATLDEFVDALRMQQITGQTITYADREGNILHHYGAAAPIRARGGREFWQGVVPGDEAALLWDDLHPIDDLPLFVNPESGWVQNANEFSVWATYPLAYDLDAFPAYLGSPMPSPRAQHSIALLSDGTALSLDEIDRRRLSSRLVVADRLLPDLLAAAVGSDSEAVQRAVAVLHAWDRSANMDSQGGVLFQAWIMAFQRQAQQGRRSIYARPWTLDDPMGTPSGLNNPEVGVAVLEAVVGQLDGLGVPLDVPWGAVSRIQWEGVDIPSGGGPGALGSFRVMNFQPQEDGRSAVVHGDTFVLLVAFGDTPEARAILTYGNSSEDGSPHAIDQLEHAATGELTPVPFTQGEIEARAVRRTSLDLR